MTLSEYFMTDLTSSTIHNIFYKFIKKNANSATRLYSKTG